VLQKNDGEQSLEQGPFFEGAHSEQCNQDSECADFQPYLEAGKPVVNVEYKLKTSKFCAADEAVGIVGARFNGKRSNPAGRDRGRGRYAAIDLAAPARARTLLLPPLWWWQ
jgi:hypothetical protein